MSRTQYRIAVGCCVTFAVLLIVAALYGQAFTPNGALFPNPGGTLSTQSTTGSIDLTGPFFQSLGTNGRTCGSCHQPSDGMSVSAAHVRDRFITSDGQDPIFRPVDGANCNHGLDFSTVAARSDAYSLLRTRGLIRIGIAIPAGADFVVTNADNQYGCSETNTVSMYRRPLPSTNLRFLSTVMWDGRESTPLTGTTKITYASYPDALVNDLKHQSLDATSGHAEGLGNRPTPAEQQQIVDFEMALSTAQMTAMEGGRLDVQGATGGPIPLVTQPFFISINSSVQFILGSSGPETPGGITPGDGLFTPAVFNTFDAWSRLPYHDPRAAIARGQALFNSKAINISGVAGINDDVAAGGLVPGGVANLTGTCGTCHDTPNVGNHSFPTPLNIGVGDFATPTGSVSKGGLDLAYLPKVTVCKKDAVTHLVTDACTTTTDLGQAAIDGKYAHVGKLKGPILRGLSARAPYFHNGSAQTLLDVVRFYEVRFGVSFTAQEEADLVAFLSAL
jgi:hypothetical protein